jgi:hypothetical protein
VALRKLVGIAILAVFGSAVSACETEAKEETVQAPESNDDPQDQIENAKAASGQSAQIDVEMEAGDILNIVIPSWLAECSTPTDYLEAVMFPEGTFTWEIEYRENEDLEYAQYFPLPPGKSPMELLDENHSLIWVEAVQSGLHPVTVTFACEESGQSETHTKGVFVS